MKKFKLIGLALVICLAASLFAVFSGTIVTVFADEKENDICFHDVETISHEIFGDIEINSSEYLYNLDDSADFIYVDFENYGYVVYLKETMEMLEYASQGSLPYSGTESRKYYAGSANYLTRTSNEQFFNAYSGETIYVSDVIARSFSQSIRESLLSNRQANGVTATSGAKNTSSNNSANSSGTTMSVPSNSSGGKNAPSIDDNPLIPADPPGSSGTTYIPNAQYFLSNPRHGTNSTGTCGAVAAQLLLSYNNYYNDRRIIAPQHLNGGWNNNTGNGNIFDPANYATPNNNPNACANHMSITRETLGSNGVNEATTGTFFNHCVNNISSSATVGQARRGIRNILNARNIDFTIDSANTLGLWAVSSKVLYQRQNFDAVATITAARCRFQPLEKKAVSWVAD